LELAVESMRHGAFDFLTKPYVLDVMRATVRRACERTALLRENAVLRTTVESWKGQMRLSGKAKAFAWCAKTHFARCWSKLYCPDHGETGTGKEWLHARIHRNSPGPIARLLRLTAQRSARRFWKASCSATKKGAFTGADKARNGLFEAAHEGTLFLDEVAEMSPAAQAKLPESPGDRGRFSGCGSTATRKVDVRVLAATHRNLQDRVNEAKFREDLFLPLAVVPIQLPPLRERKE